MNKLRVFIASSSESKSIAVQISQQLKSAFDVMEWFEESIFSLSSTPIESLERLKNDFDSIIVVSNFEDKIIKRGVHYNSIRDNLIFEYALGIGYFGRQNSILVIPQNNVPKTFPSDIEGMTFLLYDENSEGLNSIERISKRIIWHLEENNSISYPPTGYFGLNILNKDVNCLEAGEYSFKAIVPYSKKFKVKISCKNGVNIGWNVAKNYGINNKPFDSKGYQEVSNIPIYGKEVDAQVHISNSGILNIDFIENEIIIDTKTINII